MFDDMVVDMEANKKLNSVVIELFLSEKESTSCFFYITIFFQSVEIYKTKCNSLFYHENTKQKRTPTSSIKSY